MNILPPSPFSLFRNFLVRLGRKVKSDDGNGGTNRGKLSAGAVLFIAMGLSAVHGSVVTLPLNFMFSGVAPVGGGPWLSLTLQDGLAADTVRLTFASTGLTGDEFVSKWYVNFDPACAPAGLAFSIAANTGVGFGVGDISTGENKFKADGDGYYDLRFNFPTAGGSGRFTVGDALSIDITRAGGLSVEDFLFQSVDGIPGTGVYYTAAHIQGIGSNSAWVGTALIPEPSVYAIFAGGVALVGVIVRRRRSADF